MKAKILNRFISLICSCSQRQSVPLHFLLSEASDHAHHSFACTALVDSGRTMPLLLRLSQHVSKYLWRLREELHQSKTQQYTTITQKDQPTCFPPHLGPTYRVHTLIPINCTFSSGYTLNRVLLVPYDIINLHFSHIS